MIANPRHGWTRLLMAGALGAASATAFAPLGLWPLMPIAFAGLIHLLATSGRLRHALVLGWWFGFGQFAVGLNWIATAFTYQAAMPAWLGWVAVILLSVYLAVYAALATGLAWRIGHHRPAMLAIGLAGAWVLTEWLRGTLFTGFAWNPIGVALLPTFVASWVRLVGTYGLSGLTILLAGAIVPLFARHRPTLRRDWLVRLAPAALVLLGGLVLLAWPRSPLVLPAPQLRIVQPNIGQDEKWAEDAEAANFARLVRLSGRPGATPRLLLWPEAAVPDYLEEDDAARARLARLLGRHDILLTGGVALVFRADGHVAAARNSLFALDSAGRLLARYDKSHLVPYGEYLPMRPILSAIGLSRLAPGDLDFRPGPGPQSIMVPGFGRIGVQICYEIIFSGHVVDAAARPRILFNPSNDAWFGAWGPPQHLAQARLRAIEEGLPVIRATPTGISAVIDADGHLLNALPWRRAGAIAARMPPPFAPTPFARFGNALSLILALLLMLAAIAYPEKRR